LGHLTKPCETCAGSGRVKREPRRNVTGEVDPLDILGRFERLCDCCNGDGEVPLDPKTIVEKEPGNVADLTG
jgi:DnaJ-class molecular chaperone